MNKIDIPDTIKDDIDEIFHFDKTVRPQDRAHAYLAKYKVHRGYSDTAMQCAALDLCRRAYASGISVGLNGHTYKEAAKENNSKSFIVRILEKLLLFFERNN